MGWSCTKAVSDSLRKLESACRESTGSSNVFEVGGRRYFFEHEREEHPDDHLDGELWMYVGEAHARQVGTFVMDKHGRLTGGHRWMRDALAS